MVHGKTLDIITDVTKTRGSIHLYTFFTMLHKFSEGCCIQWLKHAAVEQRLSKTVLLCRLSELFVVFIYVSWDIHMNWLTLRSCHPGMNFEQQRIHCTSSIIIGKWLPTFWRRLLYSLPINMASYPKRIQYSTKWTTAQPNNLFLVQWLKQGLTTSLQSSHSHKLL